MIESITVWFVLAAPTQACLAAWHKKNTAQVLPLGSTTYVTLTIGQAPKPKTEQFMLMQKEAPANKLGACYDVEMGKVEVPLFEVKKSTEAKE